MRTVERWAAAGGEPEHQRPHAQSVLVGPFQDYLEKRWDEGERRGAQLWAEIRLKGFEGSKATIYRWTALRKQGSSDAAPNLEWRLPSRRNCARLLMGESTLFDGQSKLFLHHLQEVARSFRTPPGSPAVSRHLNGDKMMRVSSNGLRMLRTANWLPLLELSPGTLRLFGERSSNPGVSAPWKDILTGSRR